MVTDSRDGLLPEAYKHEVRQSLAPRYANVATVLSFHWTGRLCQDVTGTTSTFSTVQCYQYR